MRVGGDVCRPERRDSKLIIAESNFFATKTAIRYLVVASLEGIAFATPAVFTTLQRIRR